MTLVLGAWLASGCERTSARRSAEEASSAPAASRRAPPAPAMKPYTQKIPGTDASFDMVPIPGGRFRMGSPPGEPARSADEGPQFEVEIDPFWMGKCEVTWDEYDLWAVGLDQHFRQTKPTERDRQADAITSATPPYGDATFGMGRENRPAVTMTQLAAKMYCKWLSTKTGRYYRLPTEAEWEYACRAGTQALYSFGDEVRRLDEYAWHAGNSEEKYHPVGRKKPNPWGLHDIHGNVAEWVLDQYLPNAYARHGGKRVRLPLMAATKKYPRVVRGGSWRDKPERLRSAARWRSDPNWSRRDPQIPQSIWWHTDADFVGFRVVRLLRRPTAKEAARYDLDEFQKTVLEEDRLRRGLAD